MNDFDRDTRARRSAEHTWAGRVQPAWGNANPNGGYLLSIVVDALRQASPHPDPLSITAHYLRPGLADRPCEVDVRVLRSGRQTSTARATLTQDGEALPILEVLDIRLPADQVQPGAAGKAEFDCWIRFRDGRPPDARACLLFVDTLPNAIVGLLGSVGWVPTVELTAHVRRRPVAGWVQGRVSTIDLADGRLLEDCMLWDAGGHLVAQSRQLALLRPPAPRSGT